MPDPFTIIGTSAAAAQFGGYAVHSLLQLISTVQALRDTPRQTRELLQDVANSVERLAQLRRSLQNPSSDLNRSLTSSQIQNVQSTVDDGHNATEELYILLEPLVRKTNGNAHAGVGKAWKTVVGLTQVKQIEDKLRRIQRIHADVLQQLQITDLELQAKVDSTTLRISSTVHQTQQDIHSIGTKVGSLVTTSDSTYTNVQLTRNDIAILQAQNSSLITEQSSMKSGIAQIHPAIDRLDRQQQSSTAHLKQVTDELEALKRHVMTSHHVLNALVNRHDQSQWLNSNAVTRLSKEDKHDIVAALLASPRALYDAFENTPPSYRRSRLQTRKRRKDDTTYRLNLSVRLFPLLKRTLNFSFGLTMGQGGCSIPQYLRTFVTVKRAESPIFQALDNFFIQISKSKYAHADTSGLLDTL